MISHLFWCRSCPTKKSPFDICVIWRVGDSRIQRLMPPLLPFQEIDDYNYLSGQREGEKVCSRRSDEAIYCLMPLIIRKKVGNYNYLLVQREEDKASSRMSTEVWSTFYVYVSWLCILCLYISYLYILYLYILCLYLGRIRSTSLVNNRYL